MSITGGQPDDCHDEPDAPQSVRYQAATPRKIERSLDNHLIISGRSSLGIVLPWDQNSPGLVTRPPCVDLNDSDPIPEVGASNLLSEGTRSAVRRLLESVALLRSDNNPSSSARMPLSLTISAPVDERRPPGVLAPEQVRWPRTSPYDLSDAYVRVRSEKLQAFCLATGKDPSELTNAHLAEILKYRSVRSMEEAFRTKGIKAEKLKYDAYHHWRKARESS